MPNLLAEQIDALASFAPNALPVISFYLNTQSDDHGRDHFPPFIKKEFHTRSKTFAPQSAARASFVRDVDRIEKYLATELRPSTNGLALFACAGAEDFFEAVQLNAPLERHEIYVDHRPIFTCWPSSPNSSRATRRSSRTLTPLACSCSA